MTEGKALLQVRISEELFRAVDRLSIEFDLYGAETVELLLRKAIDQNYKRGEWPYSGLIEP
jgi:hypothetical protein